MKAWKSSPGGCWRFWIRPTFAGWQWTCGSTGAGNGTLKRSLLLSLIKARKLDRPGSLFTLIGRSTFSAAQFLVNELERYTNAVFVGQRSGGKANSYGDSRKIILPHSGITVRVSTLWWQEDPRDAREWKAPDIAAELSSSDYRDNVDPALQAVLNYRPEPSVSERMAMP